MTKKWQVPEVVKLSFQPGPGNTPGWEPLGLGVHPLASISMALDSISLVSVCWHKIMAIDKTGEGERDATSSMKAGITGEV